MTKNNINTGFFGGSWMALEYMGAGVYHSIISFTMLDDLSSV